MEHKRNEGYVIVSTINELLYWIPWSISIWVLSNKKANQIYLFTKITYKTKYVISVKILICEIIDYGCLNFLCLMFQELSFLLTYDHLISICLIYNQCLMSVHQLQVVCFSLGTPISPTNNHCQDIPEIFAKTDIKHLISNISRIFSWRPEYLHYFPLH